MGLKLFELVPIVSKLDKSQYQSTIECFFYSNTILCIGTNDGFILRYSINKSNYMGENVGFKSELIDSKLLTPKKPINMITMIPEIDKIIYLSDSIITPVNLSDLEPSFMNNLRIKNVTAYCFTEKYHEKSNKFGSSSSLLSVCIRGRTLQVYAIGNNAVTLYKEIVLPELCLQITSNQNHICVACDNCYLVVDIVSGNIQKLFDFDIENFTPFVANYDEGEFLLNCLGNLGMFSSFDGQSTRPPIPWNNNCTQFQICNPYILCVSEKNQIEVYSMIDQKLKQEIGLVQMRSIKYINEENFFIVSTQTQICALNVTSRSIQIDQLLKEKQLEQAVSLFKILYSNLNQQKYEMEYRKLQVKIAFIELTENRNISNALENFLEAYPDYKYMAKLVPDLAKSVEIAETPNDPEQDGKQQQQIAVNQAVLEANVNLEKFLANESSFKSQEERSAYMGELKQMTIDYMVKIKPTIKTDEYVMLLFKLCADCNSSLLNQVDFFTNLPLKFCLKNINIIQEKQRHHSVALIHHLLNQDEEALNIWTSICDGKLQDPHFPGYDFVVEMLTKLKDHQLVWKYLDWAMAKNEVKAVEIFTRRSADELTSERMRIDMILDYLKNYKSALIIYLEYLVFEKNIKKEKYNTELTSIYLENVINLIKVELEKQTSEWKVKFDSERARLQHMLEFSSNYRVQLILAKIKEYETVLQKECAILYGKIEEHEKALKILVYTLNDYKSATEYCINNSKDSVKQRKHLFNILFSIYMNPAYSEKEKLLAPTLELLNNNRYSSNFDMPKLIETIPNNWSMKLTGEFLKNGLSTNLSQKRFVKVYKTIANNYRFQLQTQSHELRKELLYIDEDSKCAKCHKAFESSIFIRQPNGKLSHATCQTKAQNFKI